MININDSKAKRYFSLHQRLTTLSLRAMLINDSKRALRGLA